MRRREGGERGVPDVQGRVQFRENYRFERAVERVGESAGGLAQLLADAPLVVCLGSGGVGKTTLSAVIALHQAARAQRALVLQRIAGNFDSWGYRYGKNMYVYKPPEARWALIPWDIDFAFNLGSLAYGDPPTADLFADNGDPVSVKMTSHPPFRRA